jgi:uncharacterized protein YegP (UPF0339 family)
MGKFLIRETKTGIKFDLKAPNGQVIGTSGVYSTKKACMNGINSVKTNSGPGNFEDQTVDGYKKLTNPKFEMYLDKGGEYRFRLQARNGQIILSSEGYTAKASCLNGIESVRNNSKDASIVEA